MKRPNSVESEFVSSPEKTELLPIAEAQGHPAEEFIGLEGLGEFPEWRSSEENGEEFPIPKQRIA